jgi:Carboxypeptidase regulatory-like domain
MRLLFLAATACGLLVGQSDHGSIIGIVSDPKARLVQNATVDAKNLETGKTYSVESNQTGQYRITGLPEGTYEVSLAIRGFEEVRVKGVKAGEQQPARVDIVLRPK